MIYRNNGPPGGCDYGHAAFVRSVSGSVYYLDEGGWGGCNSRHGTKSGLGIYGFWCPY